MSTEEFDHRLTAYALNDPGLSAPDRAAIESRLASDPAAQQTVTDTRVLAELLTRSLATEPLPMSTPSTLAVVAAPSSRRGSLLTVGIALASLAAGVLLAIVGQQMLQKDGSAREVVQAPQPSTSGTHAATEDDTAPSRGRGAVDDFATDQPGGGKLKKPPADQALPSPVAPASGPVHALPEEGLPNVVGKPSGGIGGGGRPSGGSAPGGPHPTGGNGSAGAIPGLPAPIASTPTPSRVKTRIPAGEPKGDTGRPTDGEGRQKDSKATDDRFYKEHKLEPQAHGDQFRQLVENPFIRPEGIDALSTFGVDVDTASYSIVRSMLNQNTIPHPDSVRLEEMVNYFPYRDAPPEGKDPFTVRVEMAQCPWEPKHKLVRLALKAKPIENSKRPPSNLVFLLDVSGSMDAPNRLPLVKTSMKLLLDQLGENDRVAIVVYAGASGVVLDSTNATNKDVIVKALETLTPGGSTNGGSGIHLAYEQAVKNFRKGGTNRVILCTDGDFNVGTTSTQDLIKLIEEKRSTGVFLSIFGFGMGNLRDEMMVQLAGKGNGNYAYIDTIQEAKKALVEQVSGTLVTVAKDVKVQIEFNPAKVAAYRLLGYEKRILAAEDFHNDKKDAGEMGAGHVVTALYELIPVGAALGGPLKVDGLRYQPAPEAPKPAVDDKTNNEAFVVKLRHKQPDADVSTLREIPVADGVLAYSKASEDFQFASSVAAFAMLLKNSPYAGQASFALVEELATASMRNDPGAYRAEFLQLVKKAKTLMGKP